MALPLAVALAACGGGGGGEETAAPVAPVETAASAIVGFDSEFEKREASTLALFRSARERPAELRSAALSNLGSDDAETRYAAVLALSLTAEAGAGLQALAPFLQSPDVSERLLAAAAMVTRGEAAGLPVLIEALGSPGRLRFGDPPQPAWQFARLTLIQHTDEDLGLLGGPAYGAPQAAAAQAAWRSWWGTNQGRLRWNGRYFEVPE